MYPLSKDPIGIAGGLNQYVFCGNNPVNLSLNRLEGLDTNPCDSGVVYDLAHEA